MIYPIIIFFLAAAPQDSLLAAIQERLETRSQAMAATTYSCLANTIILELDDQGRMKRADTIVSWQKFRGDSLLQDSIVHTTRKKEKKHGERKHEERVGLPELTDTSYAFQLLPEGRIAFRPKRPKKGDLAGQITYDPAGLDLRRAELAMARPKGPVREFAMDIDWTAVEGLLVPERIRMRARWKFLVISGRMEMEIGFSKYTIYK